MGLRLLDPEPGYLGNQKGVSANEEIAHSTDFNFFRKGCATVFGGEKPLCFATIDRGFRRFRSELYEEEKPLLSFPPQIGTTFDVTTWTATADKDAKIYLYGVCIELPAAFANALVYVSMCANGETLVMSSDGEVLAQTPVPTQNMHDFARDDRPVAKVRPSREERKASAKRSLLEAYTKIMS